LSPGFLQKPISDSLDITFWLCERHPDLRPREHAEYVNSVLQQLHAINFFTLSMRSVPERANMMEQSIQDKINAPELSERHRKALEYKLTVWEQSQRCPSSVRADFHRTRSEKVEGVKPDVIKPEIERARTLLRKIDEMRNSNHGTSTDDAWIFGTTAPTALDTTLICFVARLMDVKLEEIIPAPLLSLTQKMRETAQFQEIWAGL
jgi:hypothetical protein